MAKSLFPKATSEGPQAVTAAILWLKTRGGWRETPQAHEVGVLDLKLQSIPEDELVRMLDIIREINASGP